MDSRTKKEIRGVSLIGAALAVGVAISNRKKIKRGYDIKKYNFLNWKDTRTQDILNKAEKKVKDLQDKSITERQIAW